MLSSADITILLRGIRSGDKSCESQLLNAVYRELRRLAAQKLRGERRDHTLQPSALVNEVYLRMIAGSLDIKDRVHFFSLAAQIMRNVLIDHARAKRASRRHGGVRVDLQHAGAIAVDRPDEVIALDEALVRLSALNRRHSQVVDLHFFAGMSFDEIGEVLNVSSRTAKRDWNLAKAWLQVEIVGAKHDT